MAHQYIPKIFHDPHKNPPAPSYILNARLLNLIDSLSVSSSVSGQMNQSNIPANTPEECYRKVLAIPVSNTFITEMEFRFNELNQKAST